MKKTIAGLEKQILDLEHALRIRDGNVLDLQKTIRRYEDKLSWKRSGTIEERLQHVLSQYESITQTSVIKVKDFMDDVKTQFKALELVVEGISSDGYNHTHKRIIANHVINLLRNMAQRINETDFDFTSGIYDRYDYFRSRTPEKKLYEKYNEIKYELESLKKQKVPDLLNTGREEIPF